MDNGFPDVKRSKDAAGWSRAGNRESASQKDNSDDTGTQSWRPGTREETLQLASRHPVAHRNYVRGLRKVLPYPLVKYLTFAHNALTGEALRKIAINCVR